MTRRDILAAVAVWIGLATFLAAQQDDVRELINRLKEGGVEAKIQAIDGLSDKGPSAKPAVPALIAVLSHEDATVRHHAARALGAIGPDASAAVAPLTARLKDKDGLVRAHAIRSLGLIGEGSKNVPENTIKQIGAMIADKDERVRRSVVQSLLRIKPDRSITIPLFTKILEESEASEKLLVLTAMAETGAEGVPILLDALERPESRYWACLVLGEIGPPAEKAVPKLVGLTRDEQVEVRMEALMALGAIRPKDAKTITAIATALDDRVAGVRYAAAYALGNIGPPARATAERLRKLTVGKGDEFLRATAMWALTHILPDDQDIISRAVPTFVTGLKSKDPRVRAASAKALAELKAKPEVTIPILVSFLGDEDPQVVRSAIDGLAAFGAKSVDRVSLALKNGKLRLGAVVTLNRLGPIAKDAVPALVQAMNAEPRLEVRREIFFALASIGPGSEQAIPLLIRSLSHDNVKVRNGASYALGKIGPKAKSALPALRKNMQSKSKDDEYLALISAWALAQIDYENPDTVRVTLPLLLKGLDHPETLIRMEAANTLALFGPQAEAAVPALKKALEDKDRSVREAAAAALKKIER